MADKLICGGTVVFDDREEKADILVKDGAIAAIYAPDEYVDECRADAEKLDVTGLYVMPGTIDPHMHLGLYRPLGEAFRLDTPRQAVGGVTTLINYHRGKGDYFETAAEAIADGEANSLIDFALSLGLCAKVHLTQLERFVSELGITSFKFFYDKQDIADKFYGIPREEALTLDCFDYYDILSRLNAISPKLLLCTHCEDPDLFRPLERSILGAAAPAGEAPLRTFGRTRPGFVETACVAESMYLAHVTGGNMYVVHTASGSTVDMVETLGAAFPARVTLETCPQYLLLDEDSPCGLDGKVNPPLHTPADRERLWRGIRDGSVRTMGTDNVPVDRAKKYERGESVRDVWVGFPGAGMILPCLIDGGYHKHGIPLHTLSRVNSANAADIFCLDRKGRVAVGCDADLAIVDLDWEREITPELYGCADFSVYAGMKLRGWPRYTLSRGEVIQRDGVITATPGRGRYIRRSI